jgi:uncharacterized protein with NAD-binding domain and iron-sulfur cluster
MVMQEGFLRSRDGANIGWAKVGLTSLIADAARRYIEKRGGEVRTGVELGSLTFSGGIARVIAGGSAIAADSYVLAIPAPQLFQLLPLSVRADPFFTRFSRIQESPIVNVHLWYDRAVWDGDFAVFLNTPVQWVFNKTRLWRLGGEGQYLDISLSGARDFVDLPAADIQALFVKEMAALFPVALGANVTRAIVVKQRDATFAPAPGIAALRPSQRTPIPNLFLAGDWTDTGWPATMEGAVRSGRAAARELVSARGAARPDGTRGS